MTAPIRPRLLGCFQAVFPEHTPEALLAATPDTVARWDSGRHFLLLQLVEEEFGLRIPELDGGELLGFDAFEAYLAARANSS